MSCRRFQTLASTLTEAFTDAAEVAQHTPGETGTVVRAYASLVMEQINSSSSSSSSSSSITPATAEETEEYQARCGCGAHQTPSGNRNKLHCCCLA